MTTAFIRRAALAATALASAAIALTPTTMASAQTADTVLTTPDSVIELSQGKGTLVTLPQPVSDIFIVNQAVADVQVKSARQIYVMGTGNGETSLYATDARGRNIYSATVRVARNIDQTRDMLRVAMPDSDIGVLQMNGMVLLTGTVATPSEIEEASRLVEAFAGNGNLVVNKLKAATPAQVMLRVRFAEVSRVVSKQFGMNVAAVDPTTGFQFGFTRDPDSLLYTPGTPTIPGSTGVPGVVGGPTGGPGTPILPGVPAIPGTPGGQPIPGTPGFFEGVITGSGALFQGSGLLGLDVAALIDAMEDDGLISVLAEPNLTALSGETASFLAGGEFPIAVSDGDGGVAVEFKQYGVGITFTPTVMAGDRISLRVAPEVSDLTEAGAIRLNNISIPALSTRRAETSVELGSGESFMIGGLLRNNMSNSISKTPFLGDLPILGALFRSSGYRRDETELMIIVTPYLVKPTPQRMALPTDGLGSSDEAERILMGQIAKPSGLNPVDARLADGPPAGAAVGAGPAPGFSMQ
ncbi:MAG: type II and III secretion system protein family protein [Pacificimonas sp.]